MSKSMKKMLILAAVQTAVGVAVVPTGADAMLARGITPEPIVANQVARNLIRPYKGNSGKLTAGVHRKVSFEIELAGSGEAGVPPAYGPVLRACGFAETVTAGVDTRYEPVSEGEPILTLFVYVDGTLYEMIDSRGTVNFELNSEGIPVMKFEFLGKYVPPSETAMPTGVGLAYEKFMQPLTVGGDNTPTLSVFGFSGCTSALTINWANQLAWKTLINCAGSRSPDRQPTGSITMELPKVTEKDWAEAVRKGETGPLNIVHGVDAGNIVELQMPAILPNPFSLQDDGGIAMIQMPFDINPIEGDDELVIIVR